MVMKMRIALRRVCRGTCAVQHTACPLSTPCEPFLVPCRVTEVYEPHRDAWAAGGVLPSSLPFADGAPRGGGGAAVVGGSLHCSTVLLCDHGGAGFVTGPSMARPRVHSAVASVAGTVYVLVSPYMS